VVYIPTFLLFFFFFHSNWTLLSGFDGVLAPCKKGGKIKKTFTKTTLQHSCLPIMM
jgi:hypothetical protein